MSIEQILKVLKNERECIARQSRPLGEFPQCRKNDDGVKLCEYCDLCLPDTEILEVYDFLINGYELLQNEGAESYSIRIKTEEPKLHCTSCGGEIDENNYCKECGYKLYDVTTGNDIMRQYKSMPPIEEGDTE